MYIPTAILLLIGSWDDNKDWYAVVAAPLRRSTRARYDSHPIGQRNGAFALPNDAVTGEVGN